MRSTIVRLFVLLGMFFPALASAATLLGLNAGWNLLGNGNASPIDVATTFGDATKITTVWKWNKVASKWAFYAPSLTASNLTAYANGKGYDVLTSISPKEGFWVNASTSASTTIPVATGVTLVEFDLRQGWNLVGSADDKTPSQLNQGLAANLSAASKEMVSAWAWDVPNQKWKFYAPALEAQGGTVLADYASSKGYLPFIDALSASDGFWLNVRAISQASGGTKTVGGTTTASGGSTATTGGTTTSAGDTTTTIGGTTTIVGGTVTNTGGTLTSVDGMTTGGTIATTGGVTTVTGGTTTTSGGTVTISGGTTTVAGGTFSNTGGTSTSTGGTSTASGGVALPGTIGNYSRFGPVHQFGSWNGVIVGRAYLYSNGRQVARTDDICQFRHNKNNSVSEMVATYEKTRYDWEDLTLPLTPPITPLHLIASGRSTGLPANPGNWVDIFTTSTSSVFTLFLTYDGRLCVEDLVRGDFDFSRFAGSYWDDFSFKPFAGKYVGKDVFWIRTGGTNLGFDPAATPPEIQAEIVDSDSVNIKLTIGTGPLARHVEFSYIDNREYHPPLDLADLNNTPPTEFPEHKYRVFSTNPFVYPGADCMYLEFARFKDPLIIPPAYYLNFGCKNYDSTPGNVDIDGTIEFTLTKLSAVPIPPQSFAFSPSLLGGISTAKFTSRLYNAQFSDQGGTTQIFFEDVLTGSSTRKDGQMNYGIDKASNIAMITHLIFYDGDYNNTALPVRSLGLMNVNGCIVSGTPTNTTDSSAANYIPPAYYPTCSSLGINVNAAAGTLSFSSTALGVWNLVSGTSVVYRDDTYVASMTGSLSFTPLNATAIQQAADIAAQQAAIDLEAAVAEQTLSNQRAKDELAAQQAATAKADAAAAVQAMQQAAAAAEVAAELAAQQAAAAAAAAAAGGSGTAAQYFTRNALGNTWTWIQECSGTYCNGTSPASVSTITANAGGVITFQIGAGGTSVSSTSYLDVTGALTANSSSGTTTILPASFTVGTSWVSSPASSYTSDSITRSTSATQKTIVAFNVSKSISAGTFTDCLQISSTSTSTGAGLTTTTTGTEYYSASAGTVVESTWTMVIDISGAPIATTIYTNRLQAGYVANP